MSDYIPNPQIETRFYFKEFDFTLTVVAYRHITATEARQACKEYCERNKLKHPPRGGSVRWRTLHGFDLESGL